ncbi:MAG: hypothetical protein ACYDCQ_20000 [Dehalococcoidia bacterium]
MTTPIITAVATTEGQRVKILVRGMGATRVWQCACGAHGRPEHTDQDAYLDWERHRAICALRPTGTPGGAT